MNKNKIFWMTLLGIIVFGLAIFNGFVWDDEEQIVANQAVHSLSSIGSIWTGSTFNSGGATSLGGLYYKPLMTTAYAFLYTLGNGSPAIFHIFQIGIHIISAYFLYLALNKILKKEMLAYLLAIIWMIHPANVEAVVYVAALQDTLSFFMGVLALYFLTQKSSLKNNLIVPAMLLLSLFSKETGVVWLAICGVYLFLYERKRIWKYLLGLIGTVGIYLFMRVGLAKIGLAKHGLTEISTISLSERIINIPKILLHYLKISIFPWRLIIDEQWVVKNINWGEFWWPLLIVLGVAGGVIYFGKQIKWSKEYWFFTIWTTVATGLHLQIFPLDMTVADRWWYLPMAGLLGLVGVGLSKTKQKMSDEKWITVGALILILSIRSLVRVTNWHDGLRLYEHDIKYNQYAFDLSNNYGVELFRVGRYEEAGKYFEQSVELAPHWWTNYSNLGAYWERKGDLKKAEELYKKAIDNGNYYLAYENYAGVLIKQEKFEEVEKFLQETLLYYPGNERLNLMYQYTINLKTPQ